MLVWVLTECWFAVVMTRVSWGMVLASYEPPSLKFLYLSLPRISHSGFRRRLLSHGRSEQIESFVQLRQQRLRGSNQSILTPTLFNLPSGKKEEINRIKCGANFTLLISNENNIFSFGDNSFQQLGYKSAKKYVLTPHKINLSSLNSSSSLVISSVSCGDRHVLVLFSDNRVASWGCSTQGCLGFGEIGASSPGFYFLWFLLGWSPY